MERKIDNKGDERGCRCMLIITLMITKPLEQFSGKYYYFLI